jgi:hypothetical protein
MELPNFLSKEGRSLVYNKEDSTFVFYVPSVYFNNTSKVPIAEYYGNYVTFIGICNWAIIDSKGHRSEIHPFIFPTMFMCKPGEIDTNSGKGLKLDDNNPSDYVLLKFKKGDEVISDTRVPKDISNVEMFFKMMIITAKIPTTISYDKIWELFFESAKLNGLSYGLNIQLFGILIRAICRDPKDFSKQFTDTDMKDLHKYTAISIKTVPKYISPYTSLTSENWDDAIRGAVLLSDKVEKTPESPLEKILTT